MRTNYKSIAMKCTQEQFDGIKDLIPLPIEDISSFEYDNYLVNNLFGEVIVTNYYLGRWNILKLEIIEEFDGKYFLECCGVEDVSEEKIWKGSEMQYKRIDDNLWFDCLDVVEYRLKPKPNLDADIEALQAKAKELGIKLTILTNRYE
jgi:hypothetical protein